MCLTCRSSPLHCQFDGSEVLKQGASLYDLADWMVELGVYHAIVSTSGHFILQLHMALIQL